MIQRQVLEYARANRSRFVNDLAECVRFPTISAQINNADPMQKCAAWLQNHLQEIGLENVQIVQTKGNPIVFAESQFLPGLPTVLIYGHYDVQPADPLREWASPPFQPIVRGSYLYGRGASDDKGQLFTHIKALECYLRTTGKLPVNVKCLFEGEEEIGSPNLSAFLMQHQRDIAADAAVVSDMPILGPDRPAITYALRGSMSLELEVRGPEWDLHSGLFGGAVHNPLQALCEIVGRLHDAGHKVAIPGFYDRVQPGSDEERHYLAHAGPTEDEILSSAGVARGWGESQFTAYERTTIRPSLSVNGIVGGYQGSGSKSIIPSRGMVKLNFRLVPDQDPREIHRLFRNYIADITPPTLRTTIRIQSMSLPVLLPRNHPVMEAADVAYRHGFGRKPVFLRSGGTIPVVNLLYENLGIPTVLMGFALPDDGMHAPNEKFYLPNFFRGIATSITFLSEMALRLNSLDHVEKMSQRTALRGVVL